MPRRQRHTRQESNNYSLLGIVLLLAYLQSCTFASGKTEQGSNRIINGENAPPHRFPYAASLRDFGSHKCGGTLIAPDIILTAGHCGYRFGEVQLGRYNFSDYTEQYESFVIENAVRHPEFLFGGDEDVDEYDFFIAKLYGVSNYSHVRLNRNPALPKYVGDPLLVIGWGATDPEIIVTTDVLQETTVEYIPNDICTTYQGNNSEGEYVDFDSRVIGVTLCAANFAQSRDSCQGDSGGPITIKGANETEDRQVGLTSYGPGDRCADPDLPAVYARVSYVMSWINEVVCNMSLYPPEEFGCPVVSNQPDLTSAELFPLAVNISFGFNPQDIGWILQSRNDQGFNVTYANAPIFSYTNNYPEGIVQEVLQIPNNREYTFTLMDRSGYGMLGGNITIFDQATVHVPTTPTDFQYSHSFTFVVGIIPSQAPTHTPSPTVTVFPSSTPTVERPFITLVVTFDAFPEETGWKLEALVDKNSTEVLQVVYPGTYSNTSQYKTIEVDMPLYHFTAEPLEYKFTMTDNERDGMCCSYGQGQYQVWLGPANNEGTFLFEGGDFFLEDTHTFVVKAGSTEYSVSPTTAVGLGSNSPVNPTSPVAVAPSVTVSPTSSPSSGGTYCQFSTPLLALVGTVVASLI